MLAGLVEMDRESAEEQDKEFNEMLQNTKKSFIQVSFRKFNHDLFLNAYNDQVLLHHIGVHSNFQYHQSKTFVLRTKKRASTRWRRLRTTPPLRR